ncbi:hypothetical protein [Mycobacteroides abscessus]|uniref:hypothetical protein n=1 Tax=Mycobacteroides abscessus TaxID=36809 RepID=UPI000C269256|nr:hypothetical protein [Mycobacteroides abscessus]MBN7561407.1 hypothetical protein [Mycobacteroides abscessus subsp. abscessus]
MGQMLQADIDALRRLGQTLASQAAAINAIQLPAVVVMPGSPVEGASRNLGIEVKSAYSYMGKSIDRMGGLAGTSATTYEDVDRVFADQLSLYRAGQ